MKSRDFDIWPECSDSGRVYALRSHGVVTVYRTLEELRAAVMETERVCPCDRKQRVCVGYEGPAR